MKKNLLFLAPLSMLALAACNKDETKAEGEEQVVEKSAEPIEMPPPITSSGTYRCADNTILYVDFFGENEAAAIRVGEKVAPAIRVTAPEAAEGEERTGPMKSEDGEASLAGSGKQINVKLPGKGAQTCKG